jgi:hypothetical protein
MSLRDILLSLKTALVEVPPLEVEVRSMVAMADIPIEYMEKSADTGENARAIQVKKEMSDTIRTFESIAQSDSCEAQLDALANLIDEMETDIVRRGSATLDSFYHGFLIVGVPEAQKAARELRDKVVRIETIRDITELVVANFGVSRAELAGALGEQMFTNIEFFKSLVEELEKVGLPGDWRERLAAIIRVANKAREFKRGTNPNDAEEGAVIDRVKNYSTFVSSMYDLAAKAEVIRLIAERLTGCIKSTQIRHLQGKLPVFVRLDPSIENEQNLEGKVDKMIALVAEVDQLNN